MNWSDLFIGAMCFGAFYLCILCYLTNQRIQRRKEREGRQR